jgi:hypothetical protein
MARGEAKGRIVPVRFRPDDLKVMEGAAKSSEKTVSEWIRNVVSQVFPAYCPACEQNVTAIIAMNRDDLTKALERDADVVLVHAFPLAPDHKFLATTEQKRVISNRIARGIL